MQTCRWILPHHAHPRKSAFLLEIYDGSTEKRLPNPSPGEASGPRTGLGAVFLLEVYDAFRKT